MKLRQKIDFDLLKYQFEKKWKEFKSTLFVIWFFGSIALMVTLAVLEQNLLSTCILGHYFAMFGYLAFDTLGSMKNIKRTWPSLLFMLVGITIMVVCLLLYFEII